MNSPTIAIPRPEHPKPQFYRDNFRNLNGLWDFDYDYSDSKKNQGWAEKNDYPYQILVPFCPESKLSGIGNTDFMEAVWYHKTLEINARELQGRILLHFGAVDYHCEVYVNGKPAGSHDGGYTSFVFDITDYVFEGNNELNIYAADHLRSRRQPAGKQSIDFASKGCYYTRTTGIWQTVWLEFVPSTYLTSYEAIPDPDNACVHLKFFTNQTAPGMQIRAEAFLDNHSAGSLTVDCSGTCTCACLSLEECRLWEPASPTLYDLKLTLFENASVIDTVNSYFGLRTIALSGDAILLNNRPFFQRLVLDQGFYPDGIYTAPSDEALKHDIELSMAAGFNGARLHEKVFEERFLYWADKLGYLVWGEYPNWGIDMSDGTALCTYLPEWLEAVKRDFNHPSLIGWCPFNEVWDINHKAPDLRVLAGIYYATKAVDPTRPCIDTSGGYHIVTDIYDVHDYEQDPVKFRELYGPGTAPHDPLASRQSYGGEAFFVSEYGGTWWNEAEAAAMRAELASGNDRSQSWGYGRRPMTELEAGTRIAELSKVLLDNPKMCAFCYTQLTDVEQEQNGLYYYDRSPKFSPEVYAVIREGLTAPAAIEQE